MLDKRHEKEIKEFVLKNIVAYCDKCGTPYKPEDLTVMYDNTNLIIVQATCPKCKAQYIVQLVEPLNAARKFPVVLDLPAHRLAAQLLLPPVSTDFVLELHSLLSQKRVTVGDFLTYIGKDE